LILLAPAAWAQEPSDPPLKRRVRSVRSDVRVVIEETPEGDYDHDYYEQPWPVERETGSANARSRIWYRTVCRPQEEDRSPLWVQPASPSLMLPLSISGAVGFPRLSVTTTSSSSSTTINGRTRSDPIITKPSTKPAVFGGGGGAGSATSSDAPFLYGPDFDLLLVPDVAGWRPTRWMPADTSLRLYVRALFGAFEVFDTPTSLQLYGIGPRLAVPLAKTGSLELAVTVSAGPAFLHTGIGDAVGFDGGIGLRFEEFFTPGFSFVAAVEANLYFSQNVSAFGPVINLGFNLAW
jgi:hypothetical protein